MKFYYPYKQYFLGFVTLMVIFFYGILLFIDVYESGLVLPILGVLLIIYTLHSSKFYLNKVKVYMDRFIKIDDRTLVYHDHELEITIEEDALDVIFLAKHKQHFKTHSVLHVFKNDGSYYYITNDINRFNKVIETLSETYPDRYYTARRVIKGVHKITKGYLFYHL